MGLISSSHYSIKYQKTGAEYAFKVNVILSLLENSLIPILYRSFKYKCGSVSIL